MNRLAILSALGVFAASSAQAAIKCTAVHEWLNEQDRLEHVETELKKTFESPDMLVLEADLDGRNFSLRGDPKGEEFLLFITEGPDYQKGIITNASFNRAGQLRVSSVDGAIVHKLICQRD